MAKLVIGLVFIIGGLSGKMALRGTQSGVALAVLGLGLCIWGGIQMASGARGRGGNTRRSALPRRQTRPPGQRQQGPGNA